MDNGLRFASTPTLTPSSSWKHLSNDERMEKILGAIRWADASILDLVEILAAKEDGQVICTLKTLMSASQRGNFLLNLEDSLKRRVDEGVVVWLAPLGDKNSLRRLRGIEVKYER